MLILYNSINYILKKYNTYYKWKIVYIFFLNFTKIIGKKSKYHIITIIIINNDE